MQPISPSFSNHCHTLKTSQHLSECVDAAKKVLIHCKIYPQLNASDLESIHDAVRIFSELDQSSPLYKYMNKIRKVLSERLLKWPLINPKPFHPNNSISSTELKDSLIEEDTQILRGLVAFLKKHQNLLDPNIKLEGEDCFKQQIISSFLHSNSPFNWNLSPQLLKKISENDPAIISFLSQDHIDPIHTVNNSDRFNGIRSSLLRELLSHQPKRNGTIGIIGAGITGILRAILCSLLGFKVQLIEKRSHHLHRNTERNNTLVIGHRGLKDVSILACLGIWEKLLANHDVSEAIEYKSYANGYYVTISDLEKRALEVLEDLFPGTLQADVTSFEIKHQTEQSILINFNGNSFELNALVVCDGAHSNTLKNLGIKPRKYTNNTRCLVSSFKRILVPKTLENLDEKEKLSVSQECGVILRHKVDYIGSPITFSGKQAIAKASSNSLESVIEKIAISNYCRILKTVYGEDISSFDLKPESAELIKLSFHLCESPLYFHHSVPILVRGDANISLHPASGRGAQSAIESLKHDSFLFTYFNKDMNKQHVYQHYDEITKEHLKVAQKESMRAQATHSDKIDKPGFFLGLAEKYNLLSESEAKELLYLIYCEKNEVDFEKNRIQVFKNKLIENYWSQHSDGTPLFDEKLEPTPWFKQQSAKWVEILKKIGFLNEHDFQKIFKVNANMTDRSLRLYAMGLYSNSQNDEHEIIKMSCVLGILGWINQILKIEDTCTIM